MPYKEPQRRTIRLDDDVWDALKKLPESPNKFLRRVLSAGGAFGSGLSEVAELQDQATKVHEVTRKYLHDTATIPERDRKPLLKPKERK